MSGFKIYILFLLLCAITFLVLAIIYNQKSILTDEKIETKYDKCLIDIGCTKICNSNNKCVYQNCTTILCEKELNIYSNLCAIFFMFFAVFIIFFCFTASIELDY